MAGDLKVRSLCGITWHDPFLPRVGYRSWLDASQRRGEWPLTVWSSDRSLSAFAAFPNHPEGTTTRPTRPSSSNVQFKRGSDGRQRWTNVSQYDHHFRIMAQLDYRVANKIEKKEINVYSHRYTVTALNIFSQIKNGVDATFDVSA